jgi:hypothetical protein
VTILRPAFPVTTMWLFSSGMAGLKLQRLASICARWRCIFAEIMPPAAVEVEHHPGRVLARAIGADLHL